MLNLFESRNKGLSDVLKMATFLGRSLRENVELLAYSSDTKVASFITESKKVISGKVTPNNKLINLTVTEADQFLDEDKFNSKIEQSIGGLLNDINVNSYSTASNTFDSILDQWKERSRLTRLVSVLESKSKSLAENKNITNTSQYRALNESLPILVKFLKANKEKVSRVPELLNGVALANTIAASFSLPKISYESLSEAKEFEAVSENSSKLLDIIAKQELIRKELVESKRDFDSIWSTNEKIVNLAESINSPTKEVLNALAEAIHDVPYLALTSKKQLTEIINRIINEGEEVVPLKEVQKFSSFIFEAKKAIRDQIITILNESYGINIQNLKDPITFKSLINTEVVILESLRRILPKDSVCKSVIKEFTELLKSREGVEAIDVNEFIFELFTKAGLLNLSESVMTRYLNFAEIANDLGSVAQVLQSLSGSVGGQQNPAMQQPMGQQMPQGAPAPMQQNAMPPSAGLAGNNAEEDLDSTGMTPEGDEEGMEPEVGMGMEGEQGTPPVEMGSGQLMASIAELEELINGLKVKLGEDPDAMPEEGVGDEMPEDGMEGEFEPGEEEGEGDVEGDINIDGGEGDDEIHVDDMGDDAEHDYKEDEGPSKKKESKPAKKESSEKKPFPPKKEGKK